MPVFELSDELIFPDPALAEPDGLLAIGGDLSPKRLVLAYAHGIFPWFGNDEPYLWWSPNPRCVLFPAKFKASKSLLQTIRKGKYTVRFDTCFSEVIKHCAQTKREGEPGTWITQEIQEAYCRLHELGFAHSVETFYDNQLVGGLYGVGLGKVFFGESMFFLMTDASKVAFYYLVQQLIEWNYELIDNQQTTSYLLSFGSEEIPRDQFLKLVQQAISHPVNYEKWTLK